jgi:hypothetical protein
MVPWNLLVLLQMLRGRTIATRCDMSRKREAACFKPQITNRYAE